MRSTRTFSTAGMATLLGVLLLALAGCGSAQPELPSFPDYPPTKAYLLEQDRLREQVQAAQAYEAHVRLVNQIRSARRANALWRRSEDLRKQRELELVFREAIRQRNGQRHFQDLQEFQSLR